MTRSCLNKLSLCDSQQCGTRFLAQRAIFKCHGGVFFSISSFGDSKAYVRSKKDVDLQLDMIQIYFQRHNFRYL